MPISDKNYNQIPLHRGTLSNADGWGDYVAVLFSRQPTL